MGDGRLDEQRRGGARVVGLDPVGLGDQQVVGDARRAAAHLDAAADADDLGRQRAAGHELLGGADERQRVVGVAGLREVRRRLQQPARAGLVVGR